MKKTIFLSLITIVIFSCQQQTAHEKGQLEGVWERIGTINYENFKYLIEKSYVFFVKILKCAIFYIFSYFAHKLLIKV